ncbi:MAG: hypothetical protein A4E27_00021 [Methanobacterium sp. PtaU1.Bin242]|nr:MAG: hypothetical protein A4E27_00021 [Methanobacterium sp. PtaU1.Bin242]
MNIGRNKAKEDLQKVAGTYRQVGKNVGDLEIGGHEAELLKIELNKLYSDGWICRLKDTGEIISAFNTFDIYRRRLPNGVPGANILNLNPIREVLLLQDRSGNEWHIIRSIDNEEIPVEPGEDVTQVGQSRFSIKGDKVELTAPNFIVNEKQFEELIGIEDLEVYIPPMISDATEDFLDQTEVDARVDALSPDIADAEIQGVVPGMIADAIVGKIEVDEFVVSNQTGRITFSNGFMVEWGYYTFAAAAGNRTQTITFTHTFQSTPVVTTGHNAITSTKINLATYGSGGTNFVISLYTELTISLTVRWLAIGKRSGY